MRIREDGTKKIEPNKKLLGSEKFLEKKKS